MRVFTVAGGRLFGAGCVGAGKGGDFRDAATAFGVDRSTLCDKLKRYEIAH
jgi:hypothetical protein